MTPARGFRSAAVLGVLAAVTGVTETIPLEPSAWEMHAGRGERSGRGDTAAWEAREDGLRFHGAGFRNGTTIFSRRRADFSQATVHMKWMAHGGRRGEYAGFSAGIGFWDTSRRGPVYVARGGGTTHHSWRESFHIAGDVWYYTTLHLRPDSTYSVTTAPCGSVKT